MGATCGADGFVALDDDGLVELDLVGENTMGVGTDVDTKVGARGTVVPPATEGAEDGTSEETPVVWLVLGLVRGDAAGAARRCLMTTAASSSVVCA